MLELYGGAEGHERQCVGRTQLAYGQVELGVGQRADETHRLGRVQQQLQPQRGRQAQRQLGQLPHAE